MRENPWQEILDTLYHMGGRAEFPSGDTNEALDPEVNLVEQSDKSLDGVERASKTLQNMGLATNSTIGNMEEDEPSRYEMTLTGEGYNFAHDRQQEKRNIRSNRSVTLLTLVLAVVGMAQATALTARVSHAVTGRISLILTAAAGIILAIIYITLAQAGVFNPDDLLG